MFGHVKKMDHDAYKKKVKLLSQSELEFIIKDTGEAIAANPDNPNCGYYADERSYASEELKRREKLASPLPLCNHCGRPTRTK